MSSQKQRGAAVLEILERRLHLSGGAASLVMSTAALSEPRSAPAAASAGTKAFIAGGFRPLGSGVSDAVDVFDSATGQWSTAVLSHARGDPVAVMVGSRVIVAGGQLGGPSADIYDESTGQSATAALTAERDIAFAIGGKAFFLGTLGDSPSNTADVYNERTGRWRVEKLPRAIEYGCAAVVAGEAIIAANGSVLIYRARTGRWSTSTAPEPVGAFSATTVGTKALFSSSGSDAVAIYDAVTDRWSTAHLSQARSALATLTLGTKALFAGGEFGLFPGTPSNVIDVYNSVADQWSTTTLSQARSKIGATSVGTKAIFAGGQLAYPAPTDVVDIFTDTAPAASLNGVVAGKAGDRAAVTVNNIGDADLSAGSTVAVYASAMRSLDAHSILIGQTTLAAPLAAGSSLTVSVRSLKNVPAGQYHLVAAVDDHSGSGPTAIASQASTFNVAAHTAASPASRSAAHPFALRAGPLHGWPVGG